MKLFIEKTVQSAFGAVGLKVQRKESPLRKLEGFCQHVKRLGFAPGTVIDVGVAYGTFPLYETFPTARHLLVEPLVEWEKTLKVLARRWSAEYVIAAAASHQDGLMINVEPDLLTSSSLKLKDEAQLGIIRQVPTIRLDTYCQANGFNGSFLIKVDVQGAELDVMDGCANILDETAIVIVETSLFRFYEGGPEFYEIVDWMKAHGFVVYDLCGAWNRPLDRALEQVDLVFVPEASPFRDDHRACTRDQRLQRIKEYCGHKPIV